MNELGQDVFQLKVVLCCDFSDTTRTLEWLEVLIKPEIYSVLHLYGEFYVLSC